MANKYNHIADVKVGKVRGNNRTYPQLRLPSQYAELVGQKASIYQVNGLEGDTAFFIRFEGKTESVAEFHERAERLEGHVSAREPCRGSDSGSNLDLGASFLLSSKQQSFAPPGKECKLECKLSTHRTPLSELMLPSTSEDLSGNLTLRATGLTCKSVTWLKKASCFFGMRPEE